MRQVHDGDISTKKCVQVRGGEVRAKRGRGGGKRGVVARVPENGSGQEL